MTTTYFYPSKIKSIENHKQKKYYTFKFYVEYGLNIDLVSNKT